MIVRVGSLELTAPDEVPESARVALEHVHQQARWGLAVDDQHLAALERAAFGDAPAARVRRTGWLGRAVALRQLLVGWDEIGKGRLSPLRPGGA